MVELNCNFEIQTIWKLMLLEALCASRGIGVRRGLKGVMLT